MAEIIVVSVVMIFFAVGVYSVVSDIIAILACRGNPVEVTVRVCGNAAAAENAVRSALASHPQNEVTVIDESGNSEVSTVLHKLCDDFGRLHIEEKL